MEIHCGKPKYRRLDLNKQTQNTKCTNVAQNTCSRYFKDPWENQLRNVMRQLWCGLLVYLVFGAIVSVIAQPLRKAEQWLATTPAEVNAWRQKVKVKAAKVKVPTRPLCVLCICRVCVPALIKQSERDTRFWDGFLDGEGRLRLSLSQNAFKLNAQTQTQRCRSQGARRRQKDASRCQRRSGSPSTCHRKSRSF